MAFPQLSGAAGSSNSDATTRNITLPATINSGDLLLLIFTNDGNATASVTTPATGWSEVGTAANSTIVRVTALARIADGTEGGSTITVTTSASERSAWAVYRITNWYGSDLANSVAFASATGTSDSPDPPSLNPAAWGTEDTLWIAAYGWDGNVAHSAYPANFTLAQLTARAANTAGCGVAAAGRELNAASIDPGTGTLNSSEDWVGVTIAVRPVTTTIVEADANAAGSCTVTGVGSEVPSLQIDLVEGTTVRATWTRRPDGLVTEAFTLTTEQRNAIVDWGNLRLRLTHRGALTRSRVTWAQLVMPEVVVSPYSETTATASGSCTVTGIGAAIASAVGTATGTSTVTGLAAGVGAATGTAAGEATVIGVAAAIGVAVGTASGSCTVTGVSEAITPTPEESVGEAVGSSTVLGVGAAITQADGTASGSCTVTGISESMEGSVGTASGSCTVTGIGAALVPTNATAAGSSTATGVSSAIAIVVGTASGVAVVTGRSGVVLPTVGTAAGTCTVIGITYIAAEAVAEAEGLAVVWGISDALYPTPGDAGNGWTYIAPRIPKSWGGVTDATATTWTPLAPTSAAWATLGATTTSWSRITPDPDASVWSNISVMPVP